MASADKLHSAQSADPSMFATTNAFVDFGSDLARVTLELHKSFPKGKSPEVYSLNSQYMKYSKAHIFSAAGFTCK